MKLMIGQRVRKLRKERNMTQAQLAGDTITRNMLSLIENDMASPSIHTLQYLAEKLDVSPSYFFDTMNSLHTESIFDHHNNEIKDAYVKQDYKKVCDLFIKYYGIKTLYLTDEILFIAAEAAMRCAKQKVLKGSFESGSEYINRSYDYCKRCMYNTEWIEANLNLLDAIIENTDCPIQALHKDYQYLIRRCTEGELYNYLYAVGLLEDNKTDEAANFLKNNRVIDAGHREHLNAKFMLCSESQHMKKKALDTFIDMIKIAPTYSLDAISRYLILKDIEYVAKELDNFEIAYKYASMRLKIISDMRD